MATARCCAPADSHVNLIKDQRRPCFGAGQHRLQRQGDARELTTRRHPYQGPRLVTCRSRKPKLDPVAAGRVHWYPLDRHVEACFAEAQVSQLALHYVRELTCGSTPCGRQGLGRHIERDLELTRSLLQLVKSFGAVLDLA